MGVKVAYVVGGLLTASGIFLCTGLMLPQHTLSFFTLYGVRVARMWTYMSSVQTESKNNDFCRALRQIVPEENLEWCSGLDAMTDTQDVQHRFCSPLLEKIWPSFCTGLSNAYAYGMGMLLVIFLNLCLQGAAIYLLWDYGVRKANPKHRKASMVCLATGLFLLVMALLYYGFMVVYPMSNVQAAAGASKVFSAVLSVSKGTGVSKGYMVLWTAALFQCVALCLFAQAKSERDEFRYQEDKALRMFDEEANRAGYGAADVPSGGPPAAGPMQGFGQPQGFMQAQGFGQPQGFVGQPQGFAAQRQDFGL